MPTELVDFFCPTHGFILAAPTNAIVTCRCHADCAPEGEDPGVRRKVYFKRRSQRRLMRKRRVTA